LRPTQSQNDREESCDCGHLQTEIKQGMSRRGCNAAKCKAGKCAVAFTLHRCAANAKRHQQECQIKRNGTRDT